MHVASSVQELAQHRAWGASAKAKHRDSRLWLRYCFQGTLILRAGRTNACGLYMMQIICKQTQTLNKVMATHCHWRMLQGAPGERQSEGRVVWGLLSPLRLSLSRGWK